MTGFRDPIVANKATKYYDFKVHQELVLIQFGDVPKYADDKYYGNNEKNKIIK